MFYSNLYRRHLLDMHIDHWDESFLSEFSPETYVENLKKARVNYAMVYLQSHAGLCYWPTESGIVHRAFRNDPHKMRRLVALCHENGIKVCGYYSLIYNTAEHDRHPDWRMVVENGRSRRDAGMHDDSLAFASTKTARYGLCCPNNPDYQSFVFRQIGEMLAYFPVDAMFFDMPFWPHTCHCGHCRAAFGGPVPTDRGRSVTEFKSRSMGEFVQAVTDCVKRICPGMPVYHNYASAVAVSAFSGCNEEVLAACDYACGDLYGDLYNHSLACKIYKNATPNPPFEQMLSRCKPALRMHTLTKSQDELCTAVASTMAHHGATLIIDAIDPVGTMDSRVYELMGKVFDFQIPYEPYFKGEMVEEVGLYYSLRSRGLPKEPGVLSGCIGASKTLIRHHIPFGVTGTFAPLDGYRAIIAPGLTEMDDGDAGRLEAFVEQGGTLYISGCGNAKLVERLTGNRYMETKESTCAYCAPTPGNEALFGGFNAKYPLPFERSAPLVALGGAKVLATLTFPYTGPEDIGFASIHSDPPGVATEYPAVTVNGYGKGRVIWSALPFEDMPWPEYGQILLNLLELPTPFFTTDAPPHVELTAFRSDEGILLHAVALDENIVAGDVAPFTVSLAGEAKEVTLLPEGTAVPFRVENGRTVFAARTLHIFDTYRIQ